MKLVKWYMDFIDDKGMTCIAYAAKLKLMGIPLGYSAFLKGSPKESFTEKYSLKYEFPEENQAEYFWNSDEFNSKIIWKSGESRTTPVSLWKSGEGEVIWNNILPRAQAQAKISEQNYTGLGYVECMSMDLPPWKLPIKILRWGRFVSEQIALVWIHWKLKDSGEKQWLFLDGNLQQNIKIKDSFIEYKAGRLEIQQGHTIRNGLLKDTAFKRTPMLKMLFPESVLNINEYKRLAPGELKTESGNIHKGWIIDETVIF
ncbi:hypothetical protein [Apibacter sp. HY039]|uniref:hypothetical protein n=1 Tax=Apibacter sp. HY039 TaxID=2501476 RepID=UPI000FEBD026|nr:hypothetical protein [Apibacter sp. HY039]